MHGISGWGTWHAHKKDAACLDHCCKEDESGWEASTAEICSQVPAVEFENRAKGRLKKGNQVIALWTKWRPQHTQPGAHFWKNPDLKKARWLQNNRIWRGNRLEASLCSIIVLSPVFHWLPLSFHAVTPLLRREAQQFKCLSPHWDKTTTSRPLV